MEYEFVHDAITGEARAFFSLEHEVIGPWIEVELGRNAAKFTELLSAVDNIEAGRSTEVLITGSEYSITLNRDDVSIQTNVSMNGSFNGLVNGALNASPDDSLNGSLNGNSEGLPEMLTDEHIHLDQNEMAGCGLDDFRTLLLSWRNFTNGLS